MMDWMRQWLLGVTCTALVLALAESLSPAGNVKKVCRLAGGLALVLAVVSPILSLDEGAMSRALSEYGFHVQRYEEALSEQNDLLFKTIMAEKNNLLYQTIIEDRTAAYIVDKAEEMGILCQTEVTFAYDEDGMPYPWEVTARGTWTQEQRQALAHMLEEDLGVPPQRQTYEERQP